MQHSDRRQCILRLGGHAQSADQFCDCDQRPQLHPLGALCVVATGADGRQCVPILSVFADRRRQNGRRYVPNMVSYQ